MKPKREQVPGHPELAAGVGGWLSIDRVPRRLLATGRVRELTCG